MSSIPPPLDRATEQLRTALMVVGVIAVAALAVAIYALVAGDDSSGTPTATPSNARISDLEDRLDELGKQQSDASKDGGDDASTALADRVGALERAVKTLAGRPATDATDAVKELSDRIDDVTRDVEQLKQQPATP